MGIQIIYINMSYDSDAGIKKILEAEKRATEIIEAAKKQRKQRLNEAEFYAKQEEGKFEIKLIEELNKEFPERTVDNEEIDKLQKETEKKIFEEYKKVEPCKDNVIKMLIEKVMEVDLNVPDVVIGDYKKK